MDIYDLGEWGWQTYTQAALRSDPMHWAIGGLVLVGFVPGVGDALKKSGKAIIEALAKNSPEAIQAGIKMLRGLSNGNLVKFLNSFADKIKDAGARHWNCCNRLSTDSSWPWSMAAIGSSG